MASRGERSSAPVKLWLTVVVLALALLVFGAGNVSALDEVTVQLKWIHQAQFAGFYVAKTQGFYSEEGIDVTFLSGGLGIDLVQVLVDGSADFSVIGADKVLIHRSLGVPIVAIATTYRVNPFVLVAFADSGIASPYDFVGRTVATTGGYDVVQFQAMLKNLGVDPASVDAVPYTYDDTPFLEGEIDVTVSFSAGSLLYLKESIGDRAINIISPDDYGVHFYSDTIIVHEATLAYDPDLILRFLRATLRGHRFALLDPHAAVDAAMHYAEIQDRALQAEMLEASIPLIHTGQDEIGWMRPSVWQGMYDILYEQGFLPNPLAVSDAFSLVFLETIYGEME